MNAADIRILVIDDDPTARLLFHAALTRFGFGVIAVESGEEGLFQFKASPFDLVLLDIDMPGMKGYEVCEILRVQADPLLPIMMVTGMDDVQSVERAYAAGATDFIAKPMSWSLIGHRVLYLLRAHQTLLDLRAAHASTAAILRAIPDLLFEVNLAGRYLDVHSTRTELLTASPIDLIGKTVGDVLPAPVAQLILAALEQAHECGLSFGQQFELPLPGGPRWFELSVSRKEAAGSQEPRFIVLSRDITERKASEKRIQHLAFFDSLTQLPNRQSFVDRLQREIRRAHLSESRMAVLFMDLDGFKTINDTLGHGAGDVALQWAAAQLGKAMRSADLLSRATEPVPNLDIARLGGDEFTALLQDITHPQDVMAVAHRILQLMREPFVLNGQAVRLSCSIGIAMFPDDGDDAATLLQHADTAMYLAKDRGRDNCQFYNAELTFMALQRLAMESDLRLALERDEFRVFYQPQVNAATGCIDAVEALIRWQRPGHGLVLPQDFIATAEQCGLMVPIGYWVLRTACADAAARQRLGHRLRVAVNLSACQFNAPDLVDTVLRVLAQTGLAPDLLELEITESVAMEDTGATQATLFLLRRAGVRLSLDDFGTGYSSLSYLKRLPINSLKLDMSFVTGLPHDVENYAIVKAILAMAQSLGIRVTAEGVETLAQARTLTALDCHDLQGYLFSLPVTASDLMPLLSQNWLAREVPPSLFDTVLRGAELGQVA